MIYKDYYESPLGWMQLECTVKGLTAVRFYHPTAVEKKNAQPYTHLAKAKEKLHDYFAGKENTDPLVFDPSIGTTFQQAVWNRVSKIPKGSTSTYGIIAAALNRPKAARAVGAANGKNPFAILVPCHRLVGANGQLRGYAGGIERKRQLLDLEKGMHG